MIRKRQGYYLFIHNTLLKKVKINGTLLSFCEAPCLSMEHGLAFTLLKCFLRMHLLLPCDKSDENLQTFCTFVFT